MEWLSDHWVHIASIVSTLYSVAVVVSWQLSQFVAYHTVIRDPVWTSQTSSVITASWSGRPRAKITPSLKGWLKNVTLQFDVSDWVAVIQWWSDVFRWTSQHHCMLPWQLVLKLTNWLLMLSVLHTMSWTPSSSAFNKVLSLYQYNLTANTHWLKGDMQRYITKFMKNSF